MLAELLQMAYDAAGLIPGAAEAEKAIALGEDAYAAVQAVEAFLATPSGQDIETSLGTLFVKGPALHASTAAPAQISIATADYPGSRGRSMYIPTGAS